jgi:hypothetical protein
MVSNEAVLNLQYETYNQMKNRAQRGIQIWLAVVGLTFVFQIEDIIKFVGEVESTSSSSPEINAAFNLLAVIGFMVAILLFIDSIIKQYQVLNKKQIYPTGEDKDNTGDIIDRNSSILKDVSKLMEDSRTSIGLAVIILAISTVVWMMNIDYNPGSAKDKIIMLLLVVHLILEFSVLMWKSLISLAVIIVNKQHEEGVNYDDFLGPFQKMKGVAFYFHTNVVISGLLSFFYLYAIIVWWLIYSGTITFMGRLARLLT